MKIHFALGNESFYMFVFTPEKRHAPRNATLSHIPYALPSSCDGMKVFPHTFQCVIFSLLCVILYKLSVKISLAGDL